MSVVKIPLNTKGKTININGFNLTTSMWNSVVVSVHCMYENGNFDDCEECEDCECQCEDQVEYRAGMIFENLERMSNEPASLGEFEASFYDPQLDSLFEVFGDEAVKIIITYGELKDWDFKTN